MSIDSRVARLERYPRPQRPAVSRRAALDARVYARLTRIIRAGQLTCDGGIWYAHDIHERWPEIYRVAELLTLATGRRARKAKA